MFRLSFQYQRRQGESNSHAVHVGKGAVQHGSAWFVMGCPEGGYKKGGLPGMAAKMKGKAT